MQRVIAVVAFAVAPLVVGAALASSARQQTARAELYDVDGQSVGEANFEQTPHGVLITADLVNLPPGVHAIHLHETGECEPPFESAGGHFNPTDSQHGFRNPAGPHAGDLPNFETPASGTIELDAFTARVTLEEGANGLFDSDGSAVIIHAEADDYRTDPAGDAGSRIACGVIEP